MRVTDPTFPALHGRPARGWVNDPNGLCRVADRWHVFFQHNPAAPVHGDIAWGHVSSTDLVSWREEPIALRPRPGAADAAGCWSGCATLDDGVPTLVYSGITDHSGASQVLLARSDECLVDWQPVPQPAVGMPDHPDVSDVRDPFLLELEGRRYAVQGAGRPGGRPRVLVYDADDLTDWRLLGTLLDDHDPWVAEAAPAHIWECPSLVRLGETWVLVVSLWRHVDGTHSLDGVRWLTGALELRDGVPRFVPEASGVLDTGPSFYAPQLLAASAETDGRVLLWGWAWELEDPVAAGREWAGSLTFPREVDLVDGVVALRPARELVALRRGPASADGTADPDGPFEAELGRGAGRLLLEHADGTSEVVASWDVPAEPVATPRLFVDGSLVEVFPGQAASHTTRAYPRAGSRWRIDGAVGQAWALGLP